MHSTRSAADRVITFDYAGDGTGDALLCYRPGEGLVSIGDGNLNLIPLFGEPGYSIGGYDFKATADRLMAFDLTGTGHKDHLLCYRLGEGAVTILARRGAGRLDASPSENETLNEAATWLRGRCKEPSVPKTTGPDIAG